MYDLGCKLVESRPFMVLNGLPGLYGFKYDSATACWLPLYLYSYKLVGSATVYTWWCWHIYKGDEVRVDVDQLGDGTEVRRV